MVNIRTKGASGEREIADKLNEKFADLCKQLNLPVPEKRDQLFQRNQLQTAVGGSDLANPMRLDIEVKRQEQLSVSTWWKQCVESAKRSNGIPILVYRQNRKAWRVRMWGTLCYCSDTQASTAALVEISMEDFLLWFQHYAWKWIEKHKAENEGDVSWRTTT